MIYIATGVIGFSILHLCDIVALKRIPVVKPLVWILGSGLLVYSGIMMWLKSDRLLLPAWSTWLGWILLIISFFFFMHSLFISLPFRKTYVAAGVGDELITTGMYALARHPGVFWFVLFMLAMVLASKSILLLVAAPIFILLDILLVVIQDKFFFGRMFSGYDRYRKETPMLMPNRKSIIACIKTINQTRA
jgi:protein-S-isoprenylcysteine O-methyltransferase Ste14